MATFYSQAADYSAGSMYPPSSLPLQPSLQQGSPHGGESEANNLLTTSLMLANGMETAVTSSDFNLPLDTTWSTAAPMSTAASSLHTHYSIVTPPPEVSGFPPAYPYTVAPPSWQDYALPPSQPIASTTASTSMQSTLSDSLLTGTSVADSPLSSPGSTDGNNLSVPADELACTTSSKSPSPLCYAYSHANIGYEPIVNSFSPTIVTGLEGKGGIDFGLGATKFTKEPRMPQRKGGIQLWQFLYTLLTHPEKKYKDIIEWTAKAHEKEFRMLEPECIAIWWGHHKNKPSMTYDKFSRSLRYYYDKGILKKIPGERYVYRFLIDPELMYHHIGTSDCRPKVKPMPQAAKSAMSKFHKTQGIDFKSEDVPIITPEPETLEKRVDKVSSIKTSVPSKDEPWISPSSSKSSLEVLPTSLQASSSTGNLSMKRRSPFDDTDITDIVPIKRCKSLESYSEANQTCTDAMQFLPSSCPPIPLPEQFSDCFSPDFTVHSHVHTIVGQMDTNAVSSASNYYPTLCDTYYHSS